MIYLEYNLKSDCGLRLQHSEQLYNVKFTINRCFSVLEYEKGKTKLRFKKAQDL